MDFFFCNIHIFHYYILIFEVIFWVAFVYEFLTDIFKLGLPAASIIFEQFSHITSISSVFHKICPTIPSILHSYGTNVSTYYAKMGACLLLNGILFNDRIRESSYNVLGGLFWWQEIHVIFSPILIPKWWDR